jgi:methionyl-tRNA formyltransferase
LKGLINNEIAETPQRGDKVSHAPKIFTDTCRIDWNKPAQQIHQLIKGLSPYPAAFTTLNGKNFKIYKSAVSAGESSGMPGEYDTDHRSYLRFRAVDGYVYAKEVQLEGKKKMAIEEFLKGFR